MPAYSLQPTDIVVVSLSGVLAYAWGLYPLLLRWVARGSGQSWFGCRKSKVEKPQTNSAQPEPHLPRIAVLISAFNEERHIAGRIRNLLAADYPVDRLRVLIGVDGATDATAAVAQATAGGDARITVEVFDRNRGKVAVLKELAASGQGTVVDLTPKAQHSTPVSPEVLVFSDANTLFERDALRRLVAPLADQSVGGVCGRLVFVGGDQHLPPPTCYPSPSNLHPSPSAAPEGVYWSWETRLKERESRLDSCLGANGAIYAVRSNLFPRDLPDNTIIDDFVIGMRVRAAGWRMLYEPAAVAYEELPVRGAEWRRRVRIGAGDFQALALCGRCLLPRYGRFAWCFWSHKVLRWLTPHLLIAIVVCGLWDVVKRSVVGGQGSGIGSQFSVFSFQFSVLALAGVAALAAVGALGRTMGPRFRLGQMVWHFFEMQAAVFVGFLRFCRGGLEGRWRRTPR